MVMPSFFVCAESHTSQRVLEFYHSVDETETMATQACATRMKLEAHAY